MAWRWGKQAYGAMAVAACLTILFMLQMEKWDTKQLNGMATLVRETVGPNQVSLHGLVSLICYTHDIFAGILPFFPLIVRI